MAVPSNNRMYYLYNEMKQDENNSNDCMIPGVNSSGGSVVLGEQTLENMNHIWQFLPTDTEGAVSIQNMESRLYIGINAAQQVVLQDSAYDWLLSSEADDEFKIKMASADTYIGSAADNAVVLSSGEDPVLREKDRKWKYQLATVGF